MSNQAHDVTELQLALKGIESRLQNSEVTQKTIAERADGLYNALQERLNAKDDTLARLKEQSEWTLKQNDTLLKQIGLRWNLLTSLTGFVGLAFACLFVYQTWRVDQFLETKRALDLSAQKADETREKLVQNTQAYSRILSTIARSDNLLTDSNREFLRAEYIVAANRATEAIDALKSALQDTGENLADLEKKALLYTSATCSLGASPPAVSSAATSASSTGLSPEALRIAVREVLFIAYDLHARANFFSTRGNLRNDGLMLLALDDSQWEGYHWIGLNAEDAHIIPEAKSCFVRSVDKNPVANKDYVNLAELSFIDSDFPGAVKYSDQYLHPLNHRFKTSLDVVAQFYFSAAGFLSNDQEAKERMPPRTFLSMVKSLGPDFSLEGTFSTKDLDGYLKSEAYARNVPDDRKNDIKRLVDCLETRSCAE